MKLLDCFLLLVAVFLSCILILLMFIDLGII